MQDMVKQQKEDRIAITRLEKQPPGLEVPLTAKVVAGLGGGPGRTLSHTSAGALDLPPAATRSAS
jgi:hypothetical protein